MSLEESKTPQFITIADVLVHMFGGLFKDAKHLLQECEHYKFVVAGGAVEFAHRVIAGSADIDDYKGDIDVFGYGFILYCGLKQTHSFYPKSTSLLCNCCQIKLRNCPYKVDVILPCFNFNDVHELAQRVLDLFDLDICRCSFPCKAQDIRFVRAFANKSIMADDRCLVPLLGMGKQLVSTLETFGLKPQEMYIQPDSPYYGGLSPGLLTLGWNVFHLLYGTSHDDDVVMTSASIERIMKYVNKGYTMKGRVFDINSKRFVRVRRGARVTTFAADGIPVFRASSTRGQKRKAQDDTECQKLQSSVTIHDDVEMENWRDILMASAGVQDLHIRDVLYRRTHGRVQLDLLPSPRMLHTICGPIILQFGSYNIVHLRTILFRSIEYFHVPDVQVLADAQHKDAIQILLDAST